MSLYSISLTTGVSIKMERGRQQLKAVKFLSVYVEFLTFRTYELPPTLNKSFKVWSIFT